MLGKAGPGKIVLVTGAHGFIGKQTVEPLRALGYEVRASTCDLLDPPATEKMLSELKPTYLLHTAWYTVHGKFWMAPENTVWLEASTFLFEKFIQYGGKRIVGVGSCAEYDWQRTDKTPWKETDPCRPHTAYGQAKLALQERLKKLPVSSAWARIFLLFGPDEKAERIVPYAIQKALAGEEVQCTEGTQVRDFIDTRVCGRALAQLLDSNITGPVNIGSGDTTTIGALVKLVCELCGHPESAKLGALPMNKNDPPFMAPDLSRLRHEVQFGERQDTRNALLGLIAKAKQL
jgi:nucleoside-diphosphate-sugar epimerase